MTRNGGVSQKLLLPILGSLLLFIAASTFFWTSKLDKSLRESFTTQLQLVETFAKQPLNSALFTFDSNLADTTLKGLSVLDAIQYARVVTLSRDGSVAFFADWEKNLDTSDIWRDRLDAMAQAGEAERIDDRWRSTRILLNQDGIDLGYFEIAVETTQIETAISAANRNSLILGGLSFLLIGGLIYAISRSVTRPIEDLVQDVEKLGEGQLEIEIKSALRKDELGQLGHSLEGFRDALRAREIERLHKEEATVAQQRAIQGVAAGLNRMADRNFAQNVTGDFPEEYLKLKDDLNKTLFALSKSFSALRDSSETVSLNTRAISSAANDLAIRTERNAAELESAARAIADLNEAVAQTAASIDDVSDLIQQTRTSTDKNQLVMVDAIAAMAEIEARSAEIKSIVSLIDDIAFQTNLLALNAGVEAARAGDAGAGFAVVASEVRALAHRSSEAAGEITSVINQSTKSVENGTILVTQAGENFTEMSESITAIMKRIADISVTTKGQSDRIEQMNGTVQHLDSDMQQNAAMFEETSATSEILSSEARALHDEIAHYKVQTTTSPDGQREAA